jgi:hypothetical protein
LTDREGYVVDTQFFGSDPHGQWLTTLQPIGIDAEPLGLDPLGWYLACRNRFTGSNVPFYVGWSRRSRGDVESHLRGVSMSSSVVTVRAAGSSATTVSTLQLYLLRGAYLLLVLGLGGSVWPAVLAHTSWRLTLSPWVGVGNSLLAALALLAVLGLRYPLRMLPLLFLEVTWKTIWLIAVALPLWRQHGAIDADTAETIRACLMGVVFIFLIPWRYVYSSYVLGAGDRWRQGSPVLPARVQR